MLEDTPTDGEPKRDFTKMFDLDRTTLTKSMVDRMERCLRDAEAASDDMKEVVAECKEAEFGKRDIEAMRTIAKLRLADKASQAAEKLEALERVGRAVGFDLFSWQEARL